MKMPKARKLPSGAWHCRVRVDGKDISVTKDTEKEAIAEAMAIKAGIKDPAQKRRRKTLTGAIDDYIESRQNILSPSTIAGYRNIQRNRFQHMMNRDIASVSPDQWQRAVNTEAKTCSAKTLTNAWHFIASVIAEETGVRLNIRLPQVIRNERPWLTPAQIPEFIKAIKGTPVEIPALLALSSLRCSELLNLRWCDIDLEKGVLRVNGSAVLDEHGELIRRQETKNKTSRRVVPIIPPLQAALEEADRHGEYVVTCTANSIYKRIMRICEENDLPFVGIHGLRHSFASLAYHLNIPEKIAMQIGGWANDETMKKIYTHLAQDDIAKHSQAFNHFYADAL